MGGRGVKVHQKKILKWSDTVPQIYRFPALWDSKQITRLSLRPKPSSVSRHLLAVPWPRPSSPLVFKPARLIPSVICLHLGKEERKQFLLRNPQSVTLRKEKKWLENLSRFLWEKRPLEATVGRAHL